MIICICRGGLANRLKPLASCYALARRTGRDLKISWAVDSHCQVRFSDLYKNTLENITFQELKSLSLIKLYADRETIEQWKIQELIEIMRNHDYSPLSLAREIPFDHHDTIAVYANDYLTDINPVEIKEFFDWLLPVGSIRRRIEERKIGLGISRDFVGVHARGSDFCFPVEAYMELMWHELRINPAVRFFVCSDTEEYEQRILHEFPTAITNPKIAYAERKDSATNWSTANICRSPESVAEAIVDMHLLAATDFKIYNPYSSFAHVVRMMSNGVVERFPAPDGAKRCWLPGRMFRFVMRCLKIFHKKLINKM
jgi:hypothetical protein